MCESHRFKINIDFWLCHLKHTHTVILIGHTRVELSCNVTYTIGKPWLSGFRNGMSLNGLHQKNWRNWHFCGILSWFLPYHMLITVTRYVFECALVRIFSSSERQLHFLLLCLKLIWKYIFTRKNRSFYPKGWFWLINWCILMVGPLWGVKSRNGLSLFNPKFLQFSWCNLFSAIPFRNPESQGFPMVYVTCHDT